MLFIYLYLFILGYLILEVDAERRAGLMSELSLQCSSCHEANPLPTSSSVTNRGKSLDINRRAVYHSTETSSGYEPLAAFYSIMSMPCLSKPTYYKQVDNILACLEDQAAEETRQAGERHRQRILEEHPDKNEDDTLDVAVSSDGTWAKRGFISLIGVVFVLSVETGEVLDYHVVSKSCQKCAL